MGIDSGEVKEPSVQERRIREITLVYYSREDVRKAMFNFSKNRECVPRYFESFGKRPDNFQYENDILEFVKKGATSFHCSEELWQDPLEISTELSKEELDNLRIGFDLLLDVDSPYLEYSKIYTELLIDALRFHGVKNFNVKYSGNKGFHIIIPWKAFPEEIYGQKTKNMFPELPKIICQYLSELIKPKLEEKILKDIDSKELIKKTGEKEEDLFVMECNNCKRPSKKKYLISWLCPFCKNEITTMEGLYNNRRKPKCPECRKELIEKSRKEIFVCDFCNLNSEKNKENFGIIKKIGMLGDIVSKDRYRSEKHIDADLVLVAPRHLFRMPLSLHEKTALSSIVVDKDKIKEFQITDANPFKIKIKDFYPSAQPGEARNLLLQALDWKEQNKQKENSIKKFQATEMEKLKPDYKQVSIPKPTEELYPPCIKLVMKGIKDGRKRALFLLINFFKSLGINEQELEKRIYEWNEKNPRALKKGYIQGQLSWHKRNKSVLPPNCDKPNYRDIGICEPDELCKIIKNPVSYSFKKYFRNQQSLKTI